MRKIKYVLLVSALMLGLVVVKAQEVSPVDFMRMNPYQLKSNPATDLPYESVMTFVIGNTGIGLQHTTLRYDKLFDFDAQGRPSIINLRQFANSLKADNFLGINANVDLFTLYRRLNKGMLTFNYGVKVQGDARFNDGLFKLLAYGNSAFVGEDNPAKVNLNVNARVYQELAVGYQLNVGEKLSLGFRSKVLFGFGNVKTDVLNATLFTDADSYALRLEESIGVRASMPKLVYVDDGRLMANGPFKLGELFRNPGFGVDLAAEYHFTDKFGIVAAVHDLGFIHWGLNNIEMKGQVNDAGQFYDDGDFLFEGMDADQLQRIISDDWYREQFFDTLRQYFKVDLGVSKAYNTMLNTNVLLRAYVDVNPYNRFSAQVQGTFYNSGFRPALTLAYSGSFFNKIDVCATYTMMKESYDNIGLGLAFNLGTFHIYAASNNVIGLFKPLNTSGLNAQFGIVFNLWTPERKISKAKKDGSVE